MIPENHKGVAAIFGEGGRPANSLREIKIVDTTFRDAHQSLWATRMRTEHMLGIAEVVNKAGFEQVDLMAPIQFDVSVRYLKEDPWERVRKMHEAAPDTKFRALIRSRNIASFDFLPDDVIDGWVDRLYENGFRVIGAFDGLNDVSNIVRSLKRAKKLGAHTFGALSFCQSPVHTDELFVKTAVELIKKADVDSIMLKDAAGLLTPERIRTLVPAIKEVIGDRPLELHSHCLTGLAPLVYLEAVELGVDVLHTSIAPLANGAGQPSTQNIVKSLKGLGYKVNVDDDEIDKISEHLANIAKLENKPVGIPVEYNALHYKHQLPGGMLSNFQSQLETAGLGHRYDELLDEVARVRAELAWPNMITPFAQFVGTQAVMNVISGDRYSVVPNEIKKYVLGYYGRLLGPVDDSAYEKIIKNGASDIALKPSEPKPMLVGLKKQYPLANMDELLLRAMFAGNQVTEMKKSIESGQSGDYYEGQIVSLIKNIAKGDGKKISVSYSGLNITILR
ncbi:pyruvate carboxylase subunit B [Marinomonas primoryensis]|uniref:Oxaloacetate decarboxylase alpha subunit n=1 Tax=Marinomonas primoryensis TaxID=178399 RepID=A0A859D084_9GAMM|nr:pyruvate carboxylase subunit B [Marinomonas primoryensis]QKK81862.1 oxaloacetate decarboxylase alpha subunit [Marinomonas primoryensis]